MIDEWDKAQLRDVASEIVATLDRIAAALEASNGSQRLVELPLHNTNGKAIAVDPRTVASVSPNGISRSYMMVAGDQDLYNIALPCDQVLARLGRDVDRWVPESASEDGGPTFMQLGRRPICYDCAKQEQKRELRRPRLIELPVVGLDISTVAVNPAAVVEIMPTSESRCTIRVRDCGYYTVQLPMAAVAERLGLELVPWAPEKEADHGN